MSTSFLRLFHFARCFGHPRQALRTTCLYRDNFYNLPSFKLFSPPYHKKKKLKTVITYFLKFFLFISFSPWAQPGLKTFRSFHIYPIVWEPSPLGGGRTGHGCGREPPQLLAIKAALDARQGLRGLPTAPILGGAEGGLQGGSAKRAYYGEGSGVERPRGKR